MIRKIKGNPRWCPLLNHPDAADDGVADTDEYELADLMAWWTEYVASGDAEADANVIEL